MAVTKKLKLEISAEVKKATANLDKLEKEVSDIRKASEQTSNAMGNLAKIAGGVFVASQVASYGREATMLSARVKSLERGFMNLGKSVGFNENSLDKLRKATDGTVTDIELMKGANNAMLLGIVESDDQYASLIDNAQRLAKAVGEDAAFGIESLTVGIGRQSKLMLDNLGIMLNTQEAYRKYASNIGKTVQQLTEEERRSAFVAAAMESINKKIKELGPEQLDLNDQFNIASVSAENFAIALGEKLEPSMTAMVAGFNSVVQASTEFIKNISTDTITNVKTLATSITIVTSGLYLYSKAATIAKFATRALTFAASNFMRAIGIGFLIMAVNLAIKAFSDWEMTTLVLSRTWQQAKLKLMQLMEMISLREGKKLEWAEKIKATEDEIVKINQAIADHKVTQVEATEDLNAKLDEQKDKNDEIKRQLELENELKKTQGVIQKDITSQQDKAKKSIMSSLKNGRLNSGTMKQILRTLLVEIVQLKIKLAIEKKITEQKRAQAAASGNVLGTIASFFATGGSFVQGLPITNNRSPVGGTNRKMITNGRTILPTNPPAIVGDNASGKELVEITPLPNPNVNRNNTGNITININAPVVDEYVVDSIIPAIQRAQKLNL